jgi:hypothetical protein
MSRFDVSIDRVILRGIEPGDRDGLVESLKRELARALTRPDAASTPLVSGQTSVLRAAPMTFTPGPAGARRLGGGIANAIAKGIRQ